MVDKNSNDYQQGFKDGLNFASNHLIDVAHTFKRDMFEIMNMRNKLKEK